MRVIGNRAVRSSVRVLLCLVLLIVATLSSTSVAGASGPPLCTSNCTTRFTPSPLDQTLGITRGPRGSIWFSHQDSIGQIDHQGHVTLHLIPEGARIGWMATNPESDVWFGELGRIGVMHADGSVREYSLPHPDSGAAGFAFARDGNIYVTEALSNAIARVNPVTGQVVEFPVPTPNAYPVSGVIGPDGAFWFSEQFGTKVARMTLDGHITEYPLPPGSMPLRMVIGPDGAIWFTELLLNHLYRIAGPGQMTAYPMPGGPLGITVGKDGQFYVALSSAKAVARVATSGQVTGRWDLPGAVLPFWIATGFGLDIWVTDRFGDSVYKLTPYATGH